MFSGKLSIHYINGAVYDVHDKNELEALFSSTRLFEFIEGSFDKSTFYAEFSANNGVYICITDSEGKTYEFDNGSGETEPVLLLRSQCPEKRMLCGSAEELADIALCFCESGKPSGSYNWI